MTEQKPSVSRIVHFTAHTANGTECTAAIITRVDDQEDEVVSLCVFDPRGVQMHGGIRHDELPPPDKIVTGERAEHQGHTWHWPERV
jgi:hypothetical protein